MNARGSHAFAFTHTFRDRDSRQVIDELQKSGLTGINLALNYHASRDFLIRQGPRLEYLKDGFHYYKPNLLSYPEVSLFPAQEDYWPTSELLERVISVGKEMNFEIVAWGVFLHNSALGKTHPDATVQNALGNNFLSELCPSNVLVQNYVIGLVSDLASRGISSLAIESLHFHGTRHGEHHERFFLEMSAITEFLLSLCFCFSCVSRFGDAGGDGIELKAAATKALQTFLDGSDPWIGLPLTKETLAEILGSEVLTFLKIREATVSSLYERVLKIAAAKNVTTRLIDQSPLIDSASTRPLDLSWTIGIDSATVRKVVDIYEPLIYQQTPEMVEELCAHYQNQLGGSLIPILRPTFPDNTNQESLIEKVKRIRGLGLNDIDFYLLDTMRPRDLTWISRALA